MVGGGLFRLTHDDGDGRQLMLLHRSATIKIFCCCQMKLTKDSSWSIITGETSFAHTRSSHQSVSMHWKPLAIILLLGVGSRADS